MTTTSAPGGVSGEQHPTPSATERQLALRAELLKLLGFGPNDHQRPLTLQTLDGAPIYKAGRVTGFYASIQGTPPVAEVLVREGEDDLIIDVSICSGKWKRLEVRDFGPLITQKYKDLVQACWEVFQEIDGGKQ